ncbi:hypothetical protein HBA54_00040 [Pelagibius litoralis]|uniref:Uncharacterized protein n=1 Tax=Pelagibius litoralis TaxID=374515 RepID=A0A967C1E6_9PROT|nr:hypothetical protein [Pelagibius litoralis]NIA66976.1 hypothetical protein [Pelagibius litoralis]
MPTLLNPSRLLPPAPFPIVESVTPTQFSSNANSFNVNLPEIVNAGNLLWLHLTVLNTGTISGPLGWSNLRTPSSINIFSGKVADGTEGGTSVTVNKTGTADTAVAQVIQVSNWSGNLSDVESVAGSTLFNTSSFNPPNLVPTWGAANTLWIAAYWAQFQVTSITSYPSDTINQNYQNDGSGGGRCEIASATRALNASSWDPGAFVVSGLQNFAAAYTFAIRPFI